MKQKSCSPGGQAKAYQLTLHTDLDSLGNSVKQNSSLLHLHIGFSISESYSSLSAATLAAGNTAPRSSKKNSLKKKKGESQVLFGCFRGGICFKASRPAVPSGCTDSALPSILQRTTAPASTVLHTNCTLQDIWIHLSSITAFKFEQSRPLIDVRSEIHVAGGELPLYFKLSWFMRSA